MDSQSSLHGIYRVWHVRNMSPPNSFSSYRQLGFWAPHHSPQGRETDAVSSGNEATIQEQQEDEASTYTLPPGVNGSIWNKSFERVVNPGNAHDQDISFTEKTMHFGIFCVTLMYFRAQRLARQRREQAAKLKVGWNIDTSVPVRVKRETINQATVVSTQAGYQRVKVLCSSRTSGRR